MGQNRILTVDSAINFALNTVSPEKIAPLFAKFGYKPEEISVQAAIDLWNEYGDEFIVPFAAMAEEVLTDADQMAEIKRHYLSLDRATGAKRKKAVWRGDGQTVPADDATASDSSVDATTESGTSDDTSAKFDTAMHYMDSIWTQIGKGGSTIIDLVNKGKGANGSQPTAPNDPKSDRPKSTADSGSLWLIVGVSVVVIVLVVILVFAARK